MERLTTPAASYSLSMGIGGVGTLDLGDRFGSLRYAESQIPFPANLPNFQQRNEGPIAHVVFSSIALLTERWQFLSGLRERRVGLHRVIGKDLRCGGTSRMNDVASHRRSMPRPAISSSGSLWPLCDSLHYSDRYKEARAEPCNIVARSPWTSIPLEFWKVETYWIRSSWAAKM